METKSSTTDTKKKTMVTEQQTAGKEPGKKTEEKKKKRFISMPTVTKRLSMMLKFKGFTVTTLTRFHIGGGLRKKMTEGKDVSLPQCFTVIRLLVFNEQGTYKKLLMMAYFFDVMEREFQEIYPGSAQPFPGGCEATLRKELSQVLA